MKKEATKKTAKKSDFAPSKKWVKEAVEKIYKAYKQDFQKLADA